ncbi:NRDE family protein [Bradyrhizobium prioriisuperbiae]|uniref:NRDE family protein n=1 Tax=Bradyrhizobium prioriisuperbiae TaxID=2854389 RepID=UPI0028E26342|nr:NRDE family protein [Bradyrhizobium prioritasuperba]
MCVLAIAWQAHPDWQLIAIANRDERHDRASAPLAVWPEGDIIAGQDLVSGGTWLGVSTTGRFAAVTNRAGCGEPSVTAPSRGLAVRDLVRGRGALATPQLVDLAPLNPLNLFVVTPDAADLWVNRPQVERRALTAGLHGLSNGGPDDKWDKIVALETAVAGWMTAGNKDIEPLFAKLREEPEENPGAPTAEWPRNAIFVRHPVYGTRSSTVVTIDAAGRGSISERRYDAAGAPTGDTRLAFTWRAET